MKSGRQKSDPSKPSRKSRPDSQKSDAFAGLVDDTAAVVGAPRAKRKAIVKKERPPRKPFLTAILQAEFLDNSARVRIKQACNDGLNLADLVGMIAFGLESARILFRDGEITAKDFLIATTKLTSNAATAVQLAAGTTGQGNIGSVTVNFNQASASIRSTNVGELPGETGDLIDVEG